MKAYGWSYRHVRYGLTGAEGWVWYNFAMEDTISAWGPVYRRVGDGYVRQETKRLIRIANEHYEKQKARNK